MKIDDLSSLPQDSRLVRTEHMDRASARDPLKPAGAGHDEARLQFGSERIRSLESRIAAFPDIRRERVEQLQRAVQENRYLVSDEQIADSMFSELFE